MSPLWVVGLVVIVLGGCGVALLARRARDEVAPTVRAFDEFRAAIALATTTLRGEVERLRARTDRPGAEVPPG